MVMVGSVTLVRRMSGSPATRLSSGFVASVSSPVTSGSPGAPWGHRASGPVTWAVVESKAGVASASGGEEQPSWARAKRLRRTRKQKFITNKSDFKPF